MHCPAKFYNLLKRCCQAGAIVTMAILAQPALGQSSDSNSANDSENAAEQQQTDDAKQAEQQKTQDKEQNSNKQKQKQTKRDKQQAASDNQSQRQSQEAKAGLGVGLVDNMQGSVYVTAVYSQSPAFQAGLREGDLLVSINGKEVESVEGVVDRVSSMKPGQSLTVRFYRNAFLFETSAKLSPRRKALNLSQEDRTITAYRPNISEENTSLNVEFIAIPLKKLEQMKRQINQLSKKVDELSGEQEASRNPESKSTDKNTTQRSDSSNSNPSSSTESEDDAKSDSEGEQGSQSDDSQSDSLQDNSSNQ